MNEEEEDKEEQIFHDDDSSTSMDSSKMDTLGPMISSRRTASFSDSLLEEQSSPGLGSSRPVRVGNRTTKMDSIMHGVMNSPNSNRRSGLVMTTLQDDLRKSQMILDVCAVDNVVGEYQEHWMEVYNKNIINKEPIDPDKYEDFVWRKILLMQDVKGYLLLHHACRRKAPYDTIKWLVGDDDNDVITLNHRAKDGNLPIHIACRAFASFDVVQLVSKDSQGGNYINVPDGNGHLPLDIFGSGVSAGANKRTSNRAMQNFTEDMFTHLINDTQTDRKQIFMAMDSICNNCPPKKFQMIVCNNLDNRICIEWLTWAFCQPKVISSIMRDFYFKVGWTAILMHASTLYLQGRRTDGYAYALYFFALVFLIREIKQVRRYIKAEVLVDYAKEIWNWLDVTVICLVTTSATLLLTSDPNEPYNDRTRTVLMVTSGCQLLHFASFLKKIFLPFATFVGGLMAIVSTLVPFMVCTALVLLAFAFMYHVSKYDRDFPLPEDQLQFDTLWVSFLSVFHMFIDAPEETASILDAFFGILTTIVLLNVVIAVISIAWDRSTEEKKALRVFWEYRMTFIQDVTLSSKFDKKVRKVKRLMMIDLISDRFDQARSERIEHFNDPSKKNGIGLYFFFVTQYAVYFFLGLFSFGYLWPLKIRMDIFGIKYKNRMNEHKPEILETWKVRDTVVKRMDELEDKISKQAKDNVALLEQNQKLHQKIDHLESSILKLTAFLTQQPLEEDEFVTEVPRQQPRPSEMPRPFEITEVPRQQPRPSEMTEVPRQKSRPAEMKDESLEAVNEDESMDFVTEVPKRRSSGFSDAQQEEKSGHKRILPSGEILTLGTNSEFSKDEDGGSSDGSLIT